jgi:cob(I)alamin adenosyltransferase
MGHRLSKIYTRTGDNGTTGLGTGDRVNKDHPRVEANGTVDELNSAIGILLVSEELPTPIANHLTGIQHRLFDLGGELCLPGSNVINEESVTQLESILDEYNANLPPLKEFILPGGDPAAAACHMARAICRRAERRVLTLAHDEQINPHSLIYLNRLSDLLFVLARALNHGAGHPETLWRQQQD